MFETPRFKYRPGIHERGLNETIVIMTVTREKAPMALIILDSGLVKNAAHTNTKSLKV